MSELDLDAIERDVSECRERWDGGNGKRVNDVILHAEALLAEVRRLRASEPAQWISVKERLPEYGAPVHVLTDPQWGQWAGGGVSVATRRKDRCSGDNCSTEHTHPDYWSVEFLNTKWDGWRPGAFKDFEVTHWSAFPPLPSPPQEGK